MIRFLLLALALVGCKSKRQVIPFDVTVSVEAKGLDEATLFWGRPLGHLDAEGKLEALVARSEAERPLKGFALRVPTPCGPEDVPLVSDRAQLMGWDLDGIGDYVGNASLYLHESRRHPHDIGLAYDNRGGAPTELSVGALTFPVDADAARVLPVWHPTCGKFEVSTGGRALGEVQARGPAMVVASLVGPRCYQLRVVDYSWDPWAGGLPQALPPPKPPRIDRYEGAELYAMPPFDWFLETPPDSIRSYDVSDQVRRVVEECPP